ncbi:hypothetical protein AGMMS49949_09160 [Alphaproteobacteria bacterium]|nr:hypothetical protein AGMMS49949_09160 [Alphaproteobacteria bacterium]GHS99808.1 hypothetical protein AGMMS50296_8060 [Alphaproteobacteria bacterium]
MSSSQKVSLKVSESTDDLGLVIATDEIELLFKKKLELHEPILDMAPTGKVYKASFRTKTKVTHCDYYLNTITDHYIVTEDLLGKEVSRTYSHRTETGYLFQERKTLVKENEETMTPGIFAWLAAQDSVFQEPHIPSAPGTSVPEIKDLLEKIEKRG